MKKGHQKMSDTLTLYRDSRVAGILDKIVYLSISIKHLINIFNFLDVQFRFSVYKSFIILFYYYS